METSPRVSLATAESAVELQWPAERLPPMSLELAQQKLRAQAAQH
jgi:hypothetical protein